MTFRLPAPILESLFLFAVIVGPLFFGAVEPWSFAVLCLAINTTVFFCALRGLPNLEQPIYRTLLPGIAALLFIGVIQRFNPRSILEPASWLPASTSPNATGRALWLWSTYAAALWCAPQVFNGLAAVKRLLATIFALGCTLAVVGIIQKAQYPEMYDNLIYGLRRAPFPLQPFGPYYNKDHAASLLIMTIFCGVGLLWNQASVMQERPKQHDLFSIAAIQTMIIFGIGISLLGLLHTRSRGALAALLITGLALGIHSFWGRIYRTFLFIPALALVLFAITTSPIADKFSGSLIKTAIAERTMFYRSGMLIVSDFPLMGTGLGTLQQAYYPYQPREVRGIMEHIHCDWLELLIQAGLAGFTAYILGFALFLRSCIKSPPHIAKRENPGLAQGVGGGAIAFAIHGCIDFGFQTPANALIFFLLLAALGILSSRNEDSQKPRLPLFSRIPQIAIAAAALTLVLFSVPPAVASWHYLNRKADSPESCAKRLSLAIELDAQPKYHYELARHLASSMPQQIDGRIQILRQALAHANSALLLDPASPNLRRLQDDILWRLGRLADGKDLRNQDDRLEGGNGEY